MTRFFFERSGICFTFFEVQKCENKLLRIILLDYEVIKQLVSLGCC